mgnify:CR=1 FL=1
MPPFSYLDTTEGCTPSRAANSFWLNPCIKDPEILALAGRFQRLSKKSKRRVVEYMDLLRLADEQACPPAACRRTGAAKC